VPSLINLRQRTAEVGGALGPPIVKGGTPREARREKGALKQVNPCDWLADGADVVPLRLRLTRLTTTLKLYV
jgi:hypothetical protein